MEQNDLKQKSLLFAIKPIQSHQTEYLDVIDDREC